MAATMTRPTESNIPQATEIAGMCLTCAEWITDRTGGLQYCERCLDHRAGAAPTFARVEELLAELREARMNHAKYMQRIITKLHATELELQDAQAELREEREGGR